MDRRGYEPFAAEPLVAMAAAMDCCGARRATRAHLRELTYSAASLRAADPGVEVGERALR